MKLKKAIKILTYHNKWRRGEKEEMKYTAKGLGIAIDVILNELKAKKERPKTTSSLLDFDNEEVKVNVIKYMPKIIIE